MVIRIVKLYINESDADRFELLFHERKSLIQASEGCISVELLRDIHHLGVFMTYSRWLSEENLEAYRNSLLFQTTWQLAKPLFAQKAEVSTLKLSLADNPALT
jgi:quinol monooxygenase YgiN